MSLARSPRVPAGFLAPPLFGPAPSAGAAALGGCKGSWSRWAGAGFVIASRVRPVLLRSPVVPGGRVYGLPAPGLVGRFRAVAGRRGFRARSFKFSAGLAGGLLPAAQRRWLWVVWEGPPGRLPRRASLLAWLRGSFPGWVFS